MSVAQEEAVRMIRTMSDEDVNFLLTIMDRLIPLDPENPENLNRETLEAIEDVENGVNLSGPYHSLDALWEALDA